MSVVTLQLGQCGNQVGGQMFSLLRADTLAKPSQVHVSHGQNEEYNSEVMERFFSMEEGKSGESMPRARAVLVDMERKAIAQTLAVARASGTWRYPEGQHLWQERGSGNNWARGFCQHGPAVREGVEELVRREAERCDRLAGFVALLSLAGGTGSGLGAFLSQQLRDDFPHTFLLNQVVWPYGTGEVIVQNYNALLTLSHLYQSSDAVLVMENDSLHKICSQLLNIRKISFQDINQVITHKLASFLQPAYTRTGGKSITNELGSMLERLVAHPQYKLLTARNIPVVAERSKDFSCFQWPGLLKHLRQMVLANAAMEEGIDWQVRAGEESPQGTLRHNHSVASTLILRGQEVDSADVTAFRDPRLYTSWMPPEETLSLFMQPRAFSGYQKSACLVDNGQSVVAPLSQVISRAWNMFASRAYVHQYTKHGLSEEHFMDGFVTLEQVLASYKGL